MAADSQAQAFYMDAPNAAGQMGPTQSRATAAPDVQVPATWGDATTVMMRNVPNKYTQGLMLLEFNQTGFLGLYDFFYLPIDSHTSANRGYAFINFIDAQSAWLFKTMYEGRRMNQFNSTKYVSVTAAALQGFEANYAHYSSARVSRGDPSARPLFLRSPTDDLSGKNGMARGGVNGRKQRPPSAVDRAAIEMGAGRASLAEHLQQTAHAINAGAGNGSSMAAINAMAAAQSAAAVASVMSMGKAGAGQRKPTLAPPAVVPPAVAAAPQVQREPTNVKNMMWCPFCGGRLGQAFRFCQYCGADLDTCAAVPHTSAETDGPSRGAVAPARGRNVAWASCVTGARR